MMKDFETKIISIRIPVGLLNLMNELVDSGMYMNRSQILREAISAYPRVNRNYHEINPNLLNGKLKLTSFRVTFKKLREVDREAEARGINRSKFIRHSLAWLLTKYLKVKSRRMEAITRK